MKENEISEIIGNISDKYVDEAILYAGKENKIHHNKFLKWGTIAACLCIIAGTALTISGVIPSVSENTEHTDTEKDKTSSIEISVQPYIPFAQDEIDTSPVYYSSLIQVDSVLNEEALAVAESSVMDITSFDESMLSEAHCCMIIEGTITNLYVKHYSYDIYSDKFEENGILHDKTDTIVYEVAVDKTWYGEDISGETILIEDISYFTEPILAVKEGGRYVLPLYEYGNYIWTLGNEYAGGDITRETAYSTIYPYHPQIEVTNDGSYIVSQDWITLTAKNAKEIIMDTLDDENFWKDKMYLVDEKTFEDQMAILLSNFS